MAVAPESPPAVTTISSSSPATFDEAPLVQFQAVLLDIPAGYLTSSEINNLESNLAAAISAWVSPLPVTITFTQSSSASGAASTAASGAVSADATGVSVSSCGRRQLLQSTMTFQSTLTFILTFTSQTASSPNRAVLATDLSTALQQAVAPLAATTTVTPVLSGANYALNASVVFPPDNSVSATPSQATLAAVNLANALTANAAQALPGLVAKAGSISVTGVSIQDALVPAGSSSSIRAPPPPESALPSSLNSSPASTGGSASLNHLEGCCSKSHIAVLPSCPYCYRLQAAAQTKVCITSVSRMMTYIANAVLMQSVRCLYYSHCLGFGKQVALPLQGLSRAPLPPLLPLVLPPQVVPTALLSPIQQTIPLLQAARPQLAQHVPASLLHPQQALHKHRPQPLAFRCQYLLLC